MGIKDDMLFRGIGFALHQTGIISGYHAARIFHP